MLRYLTAGESHGKCLLAILDGMPAGLRIDRKKINSDLARRMRGYGRGARMAIERDRIDVLSGVRNDVTIGSPIAMSIDNRDHSIDRLPPVFSPRPGHADLAGSLKYGLKDVRSVLERASARETAARVAVGAIAKALLAEFGVRVVSHVTAIGEIEADTRGLSFDSICSVSERSAVRCADEDAARAMCREIDCASSSGDTLGGVFEVIIHGLPPGLGSYAQWDSRIDARLARAVMSIQAVKGVGFGMGFSLARRRGSTAHDEIAYSKSAGFSRKTNNAGGVEGGMTNGEDVVIQCAMKPIATLLRPLESADIRTKKRALASVQRSDVCAVPAAGVVAEAVCSIEAANAFTEKFGGDSTMEMKRNFKGYLEQIRKF